MSREWTGSKWGRAFQAEGTTRGQAETREADGMVGTQESTDLTLLHSVGAGRKDPLCVV